MNRMIIFFILFSPLLGCAHQPPSEYCQDKADQYLGGLYQCIAERTKSDELRSMRFQAAAAALRGAGQGLTNASQRPNQWQSTTTNCITTMNGNAAYTNCN